ncbi:MAG: hypothetical protein RSE10_08790 [Oscillospiraceae bacterium]
MKKHVISWLKHCVWALRIIIAIVLILPIFVAAYWFNFTVDRSGYFQGDQFVRDIAEMLLTGNDVSGYEQIDERQVSKIIVQNMKEPPETVALGSSRILQMNTQTAGSKSFFNLGMVGADYMDVFGTFYLLDKSDKLPKNVIIGFDPWLLNGAADELDIRSDKQLFAEFATKELGMSLEYEEKDESDKLRALLSLSYFQGNLEYYFRDSKLVKRPSPLTENILNQKTEIKRSDGSVFYAEPFRNLSADARSTIAIQQACTFMRMGGYQEPDANILQIFDQFLSLADKKNVNIIFVLTPYHPTLWDNIYARSSDYPGFFKTEVAVRELAKRHNIPVYGSYNPYAIEGIVENDFYDGIHVRDIGIKKFFPGMENVTEAQKRGEQPLALDPFARPKP